MVQVCTVKPYSTAQVAKVLEIGRQTLHRWIRKNPRLAPRKRTVGGVVVRMWDLSDLARIRKYKDQNYRKGRGRKPKRKR